MAWIGIASYVACWMITILGKTSRQTFEITKISQADLIDLPTGDTFHAPDIVMGMLFLSIGGSIPEASAAFINARNGEHIYACFIYRISSVL